MWLLSPLSYPVPYVQMESTTQVTNVSFSYRTYQYQHMRTRQKRRKREKHIGSLYFEPSHHRHMGGKGENNMAPRGRHLIETKDQKMFIMSIVQKKGSENIISIIPQANRMKGEKISWLLRGGGDHHTIGTYACEERERTTWLPVADI